MVSKSYKSWLELRVHKSWIPILEDIPELREIILELSKRFGQNGKSMYVNANESILIPRLPDILNPFSQYIVDDLNAVFVSLKPNLDTSYIGIPMKKFRVSTPEIIDESHIEDYLFSHAMITEGGFSINGFSNKNNILPLYLYLTTDTYQEDSIHDAWEDIIKMILKNLTDYRHPLAVVQFGVEACDLVDPSNKVFSVPNAVNRQGFLRSQGLLSFYSHILNFYSLTWQ